MSNQTKIDNEIAIKVQGLSQTFCIPYEQKSQLKHYFINPFHRTKYREFNALNDVSFEVKKGEFLGIIGRNGSGKSTLLKTLAGIYEPDKGKVKVNGKMTPFLELGIGFNPELSGRENIFLNGIILGMTRKYLEKKYDKIVDFAEVRDFIDMPVKNYSSGMQVRLAFSIAIQSDADIYLVDEVLAVGDANFQEKCFDVFRNFKKGGKTVVFVSHGMGSVEEFCDRVIWIDGGKVKIDNGTKEVIFEYNRSNLEDRLEDSEKEIEHAVKKGDVRIKNVILLNTLGKKTKIFSTGEDIRVQMQYNTQKEIKNPVVGVGIYDENGTFISGPNTLTSKFSIKEIADKSIIEYTIEDSPLLEGLYFLSVGIFNHDATIPYDFVDKGYSFSVMNNVPNQNGIIRLCEKWEQN